METVFFSLGCRDDIADLAPKQEIPETRHMIVSLALQRTVAYSVTAIPIQLARWSSPCDVGN